VDKVLLVLGNPFGVSILPLVGISRLKSTAIRR